MGIEPMTSSLPRKRSTPELHRLLKLSGKRDSNPRPLAWKANALSTELFPHFFLRHKVNDFNVKNLRNKDLKHCFQQLSRGNAPLVFIKALTIKMLA